MKTEKENARKDDTNQDIHLQEPVQNDGFIPDVFPDETGGDELSESASDDSDEGASLLESRIEQLTSENARLNDQVLRERAEFANLRKRHNQETLQLEGKIAGKILQEILPALDALDQLLVAGETGVQVLDQFLDGSKLIRKQLWQAFEGLGIEEVNPVSLEFDPLSMEALSVTEVENIEFERVGVVYQKGYKFKERVIRPARVAVEKPKVVENDKAK
ncbi:MAG: nucleotide exchange factor GrpE [Spirochaetia bacterium]|nr:nucleotide exchange factor GrpE [Spirochaetia bacterium]